MPTFAGIDWGGTHHQVAAVDDTGGELFNKRHAHDVDGLDALIERLHALPGLVGVAIERSDGIIVDRLHAAKIAVFPVSPRVSARARERHQAAARKNDRFDAFVLADTLRTDGHRWRALRPASDLHAELRQVVRHRRQAVESQIMVEAQLRETLIAYHPAVVSLFSSVDRDATLAFLRDYPTPRAASHVAEARMARFCSRIGYSGRVPAAVLVERVRTNLLSASDGNVAGHRYAALNLADQLELFNQQLRGYNRRIDELLGQHPDREIYLSLPATGRVLAAELCAEIGEDRDRYPTPQVLLAEAGAAPVTLASGKVQRVHIRWACNRRLRSTTTTWAHVLKRIDPPSRSSYLAKMERGATYHGALRSVSASWLRVLWRCCKTAPSTTHSATDRAADHQLTSTPPAVARRRRRQRARQPSVLTTGVCVLHLIRNTFRLASRADWDKMARDLRPVYTAVNEADAARCLDEFHTIWGNRYPATKTLWTNAWAEFVPFLDYSPEIRRVIYSTNAIESLNARFRRATRARGHFPNEQAALKCLYLVVRSLDPKGTGQERWMNRWKRALNAFAITFEGRLF